MSPESSGPSIITSGFSPTIQDKGFGGGCSVWSFSMISNALRISRSLLFGNMAIQSDRFKTNKSSLSSVSERSHRTSRSCSAVQGRSSPMSSRSFANCSISIHQTNPPLFFHRSSVSASKIASRTLLKGVKFFRISLGEDGGSA